MVGKKKKKVENFYVLENETQYLCIISYYAICSKFYSDVSSSKQTKKIQLKGDEKWTKIRDLTSNVRI